MLAEFSKGLVNACKASLIFNQVVAGIEPRASPPQPAIQPLDLLFFISKKKPERGILLTANQEEEEGMMTKNEKEA